MQFAGALRTNTLSSRIIPESWLSNIVLVAAGSALMAASARFSYQFSWSTVPVTGQTFAVLLIGALYGSRLGAATMIAYLAEAAGGMPVLAGGHGGIAGGLATASGGYVFGFIVAAYIVGWFAERGWDRGRWIVLPMLLANAAIYVPGLIWLHQQVAIIHHPHSWTWTFHWGLWPFIAGDLAKLVAASLAVPAGWSIVEKLRANL
jgi:biotin transport system substrate-specific component